METVGGTIIHLFSNYMSARHIKKKMDYHGFGAWFAGEEELGPLTPHPGQDGPAVGGGVGDSVCEDGAGGVGVVGEDVVPQLHFAGIPSRLGCDFPRRDMHVDRRLSLST